MASIVREGRLAFRHKKLFKKQYREHHAMLFAASESGMARLELYEVGKSAKLNNCTLILISSDIIKVFQEKFVMHNEGFGFTVTTKENHHHFLARDAGDSNKWVKDIQETLLKANSTSVLCSPPSHVTEDNDIYVSDEEVQGDFPVRPTRETQMKLGVEGPLRVLVANGTIIITSMYGKEIALWTINNLRSFGYTDNDFHFEVGRNSGFGPGTFIFLTPQGEGIHRLIHLEKACYQHQLIKESVKHSGISDSPSQIQARSLPPPPEHILSLNRAPVSTSAQSFKQIHDATLSDFSELHLNTRTNIQHCPGSKISSFRSLTPSPSSLDGQISLREKLETPSCRMSSESPNPSSNSMSTESLLSDIGSVRNISRKMSLSEISFDPQSNPSEDSLYDDPKILLNAWKVHGCSNDDNAVGEDVNDRSYAVAEASNPWKTEEFQQEVTWTSCEECIATEQPYARVVPKKEIHHTEEI